MIDTNNVVIVVNMFRAFTGADHRPLGVVGDGTNDDIHQVVSGI